MSQPAGIMAKSMSGESAPRIAAAPAPRPRGSRAETSGPPSAPITARPRTACESGSIQAFSASVHQSFVGPLLHLPVRIELIPVMRAGADAGLELGRKRLRGCVHSLASRELARDENRFAGLDPEAARAEPLD